LNECYKSKFVLKDISCATFFRNLDEKSPAALTKNSSEDEIEINVDNITPVVFHESVEFVRACSDLGSRKKKSASSKSASKKARTS